MARDGFSKCLNVQTGLAWKCNLHTSLPIDPCWTNECFSEPWRKLHSLMSPVAQLPLISSKMSQHFCSDFSPFPSLRHLPRILRRLPDWSEPSAPTGLVGKQWPTAAIILLDMSQLQITSRYFSLLCHWFAAVDKFCNFIYFYPQ